MIAFEDIRAAHEEGERIMHLTPSKGRYAEIMQLCELMKAKEPQAFADAAEWVEQHIKNVALIPYAGTFGEWWRKSLSPNKVFREAAMVQLDAILEGSDNVYCFPYTLEWLCVYVVLLAQVPAEQRAEAAAVKQAGEQAADTATIDTLPDWARTDRARRIYQAMQQAEFMQIDNAGRCKWQGTQEQAAYFIRECSKNLFTAPPRKQQRTQWKPYCQLFNMSNEIRTKGEPNNKDWENTIDTIFTRNSK